MKDIEKEKLKKEAYESYKSKKNKFNYMSFHKATTIEELNNGEDNFGNKIYIKSNLSNEIIYFGEPINFNDSNEFNFKTNIEDWVDYFSNNPNIKKQILDYYNLNDSLDDFETNLSDSNYKKDFICKRKAFNSIGETIRNIYCKRLAIFCMAPSPYCKHFWDEYCDNFNGICCEYDLNDFDNSLFFKDYIKYDNSPTIYYPENINVYQAQRLFKHKNFKDSFESKIGTKSKEMIDKIYKAIFKKEERWEIELENRLVIYNENPDELNKLRIMKISPAKIYIGYKVKDELKDFIINLCKQKQIQFEIVNLDDCYEN